MAGSQNYELLETQGDLLHITPRGHTFIQQSVDIVAQIDQYEGIFVVLSLVAELGPGKRRIFIPEFSQFCYSYTKYRSESPVKSALYDRLMNLINRGMVTRNVQFYEITDSGLQYLESQAEFLDTQKERSKITVIEHEVLVKRVPYELINLDVDE